VSDPLGDLERKRRTAAFVGGRRMTVPRIDRERTVRKGRRSIQRVGEPAPGICLRDDIEGREFHLRPAYTGFNVNLAIS